MHISNSEQETIDLARRFAKHLKRGDIVFLEGDLGAGKTMFMKGIAQAFGVDPEGVVSPTFVLMNCYEGKIPLYHFDLYRLDTPEQLATVQFDEYFFGDGISIVEWPERLPSGLVRDHWQVKLSHKTHNKREICISYPSKPQQKISL